MNRPTCETCPFWSTIGFDEDSGLGMCRRLPPAIPSTIAQEDRNGPDHILLGFWPHCGKDAFCGEHPDFQAWIEHGAKP